MRERFFLLLGCVLLLAAGCSSPGKAESGKRYGFGFAERKHYEKLKGYKLSLDLSPGSREFNAGKSGELVFILKNEGSGEVRIPEWFKFDPNNLKVQCQVWLPDAGVPDPDMWLDVSAPVKRPAWRYPLTIPPGEKVFVSSKLDFLASLVVSPGAERRFFVRAKLNLTSVDLSSPVRSITVRPGVVPAAKRGKENNK